MVLREKNLAFEMVNENPWEKNLEFFALNPAGEVPVLIEDDGIVISGAYAIGEYLEEAYPHVGLLGNSPAARAEVRRLVDWFDHKFDYEVTQNILFEKVFKRLMHYGPPNSEAIRVGKENIYYHLDYIAYLANERHFLAGPTLSLADIAAASHLSALDYMGDVPWEHSPRAAEWYALMKSRPSLRAVLADRILGVRPPENYENPDFY